MSRYATVAKLHRNGFRIGHHPDSLCSGCQHRWGGHELHPLDDRNPMKGGTYTCPSCPDCFGTWSVPIGRGNGATQDCPRCGDHTWIPVDAQWCPGCIHDDVNHLGRRGE